jgi:integrase
MQRGFVRKRGATWTAYYYVMVRDERKQRSRGGFRTKAEATAHLNTQLVALQNNDLVEPSRLTVKDYLIELWLPMVQVRIQPSTHASYTRLMNQYVIPVIGSVKLQQLQPEHLDRLYADLLASGSRRFDRGLSRKTVRYIHNTLHTALKDAVRKRILIRNVAEAADPPKLRQNGEREMKTWTASELLEFLDAMQDHWLYAAYHLSAMTGMRRAEVLGLRWQDVDFTSRRVAIRQTLNSVDYKLSLGVPKTPRSRRLIALDPLTVRVLEEHRERQIKTVVAVTGGVELNLVFAKPDGSPVHPDYMTQTFERTIIRLGLTRIRLHDLRHTHASLGLAAGIPTKIMSERLGHATTSFTEDVYMHTIPRMHEEAATVVADMVHQTRNIGRLVVDNNQNVSEVAAGMTLTNRT